MANSVGYRKHIHRGQLNSTPRCFNCKRASLAVCGNAYQVDDMIYFLRDFICYALMMGTLFLVFGWVM